jgi:hypothetical protein
MRRLIIVLLLAGLAIGIVAQEEGGTADQEFEFGAVSEGEKPDGDGFQIYGYILEKAEIVRNDDSADAGNTLSVRIKAEWVPSDHLSFVSEFCIAGAYGADNPFAVAKEFGLAVAGMEDEHWSFEADHLYGRANFGSFDFTFGKQPIAWGTSYVFNPTARTCSASSMDYASEETPGVIALAPSFAVGDALSLSGYLAFQDRFQRKTADMDEGDFRNLPFGAKVTGVIGSFDLSVSFIREVLYDEIGAAFRRRAYLGSDFAGAIWNFGVYGEATLGLPDYVAEGTGPDDFDVWRDLEAAVGFDYTFSGIDLETRAEYYYRGVGAEKKADYDPLPLISGESSVVGKHYLFLYASRTFAHYYKLTFATLTNLLDGSWMLLPEIVWDAASNLEIRLGAYVPLGSVGSEYDGTYVLSSLGAGEVDLIKPQLFVIGRVSF